MDEDSDRFTLEIEELGRWEDEGGAVSVAA